jgi:iron complex outermembrane receptor protein
VQYLDAKYNAFVFTTPNLNGGFFNGTSCPNLAAPTAIYTIDCSGERPPNAPEWTVNLGAQQTIPVSFGEFVLDGRAHYQTKTLSGLEFLDIEEQPGYWLVDAAVTFYAPERRYFIGAFANNLFDETVLSGTFPTSFSNFYSSSLRPPRTYGVRAGMKF